MSERDKIHCYIRGLAQKTRSEVGYSSPKTLEEAIRIASEYDAHFFRSAGSNRMHWDTKSQGSGEENIMMDVNLMRTQRGNVGRSGKEDEKARLKKEGRCYICQQKGHMANKCSERKKIVEINNYSKIMKTPQKMNTENGNRMKNYEESELMKIEGKIGSDEARVVFVLDTGATQRDLREIRNAKQH